MEVLSTGSGSGIRLQTVTSRHMPSHAVKCFRQQNPVHNLLNPNLSERNEIQIYHKNYLLRVKCVANMRIGLLLENRVFYKAQE